MTQLAILSQDCDSANRHKKFLAGHVEVSTILARKVGIPRRFNPQFELNRIAAARKGRVESDPVVGMGEENCLNVEEELFLASCAEAFLELGLVGGAVGVGTLDARRKPADPERSAPWQIL